MPITTKQLLGIMDLNEAKRIKEILAERGVAIELGHNKQTCTRGCRVTVEVWGELEDLPKIQELLREEQAKLLEDLDFDPEQSAEVFDANKETAVCPACGTRFSTDLKECPDCGLVFVSEDGAG